jgi:hypothetical protein
MQELRNMVAQLFHRLDNNRANLSGLDDDNRSKTMERSLLRTANDNRSKTMERSSLRTADDNRSKTMERSSLRTADDNRSKTAERSLSPVLVRNKGRNRQLSPMTRSYKKTLHVCYIFIIKIYLLFNLYLVLFCYF